jgi:hypothetical protein
MPADQLGCPGCHCDACRHAVLDSRPPSWLWLGGLDPPGSAGQVGRGQPGDGQAEDGQRGDGQPGGGQVEDGG